MWSATSKRIGGVVLLFECMLCVGVWMCVFCVDCVSVLYTSSYKW